MNTDETPQEENVADPAGQLAQAQQKIAELSRDLDGLQIEQKLTHKLAAAGAVDLETAVMVAKARLEDRNPADLDGCVAQLKKEKTYLFGGTAPAAAVRKTAGAKDRGPAGRTALEQAAAQAARTGSRADLHHYLKLRRNQF